MGRPVVHHLDRRRAHLVVRRKILNPAQEPLCLRLKDWNRILWPGKMLHRFERIKEIHHHELGFFCAILAQNISAAIPLESALAQAKPYSLGNSRIRLHLLVLSIPANACAIIVLFDPLILLSFSIPYSLFPVFPSRYNHRVSQIARKIFPHRGICLPRLPQKPRRFRGHDGPARPRRRPSHRQP